MNQQRIIDLVEEKISGEWGTESLNGNGVKVLRTTNFTNEGRLRFDSVVDREIDSKIVEKKKLKFGDTIIEKSGGSPNQPVGRVVLFNIKSDEPFLCNNFTAILRPKSSVYPQYFFWSLYSKHLNNVTLRYQNKTTGILNLKLERYLEEEKINVPDLKTQQKIANILEQADAARQKRKQANQLTEQFLQSAFLEMFGDPVRNEKGWKTFAVIDVCDCIVPGRDKPKKFSGAIPWITTDDLNDGAITFFSKKNFGLTPDEINEVRARVIPKESVLITCVGDLGVVSIAGIEMVINQQLHSFQCSEKISNIFLMHCLKFQSAYMYKMASSTTLPYMNKTICNSIPIILPPLLHQQTFAKLVERVEQLRVKQRESEKELENLFNSLMQKYFVS